jgi:glucose-1-phosphatase
VECPGGNRSAGINEKSMIRNIVFDLGNVLLSFKPAEYFIHSGYSESIINEMLNEIFDAPEWRQIDNGDLTTEQAIDKIASRSSLSRQEISDIFDLRLKILFPLERNIKVLPALKKQGFRLYFLSNFPEDIFDEVVLGNDFFKLFDGGIISSRVRASKPERKIYEILFDKYSLKPEECLFIDDLEHNVRTATELGMKCIWYYDSRDLVSLIEKKLDLSLTQLK